MKKNSSSTAALLGITTVSVGASYAGLTESITQDTFWWKLLCGGIAGASGVAIYAFWDAAFEAATKPEQFKFRSAGWISTIVGAFFLIGMSSWWNVAAIGGSTVKMAALYEASRKVEQSFAKTLHKNTDYRSYISRLEGLSGEIANLADCEYKSGCVTGTPGKSGVYQMLRQMHSKTNNIVSSINTMDGKLVSRGDDANKCLSEMRKVRTTNSTSAEETTDKASRSFDCVNTAMADIAGNGQLERIAQEMESFTAGIIIPVSIKSEKQRQAISNILAGITKRASAISKDARAAIKPADFEPVSVPRMSAMKAVVVYYDSVLPAWITGVGLDLLPLILLSFQSTLAASERSRPDNQARDWTIADFLEVRDLGKELLKDWPPETAPRDTSRGKKTDIIITPTARIDFETDDDLIPAYWHEYVEVTRKDHEDK